MQSFSPWVIALLVGVAVTLLAILVYSLVREAPVDARQAEAAPRGFFLAWRLMSVAAYYCAPWISWRRRRHIEALLTQAGLRHVLDASHVLGVQVLLAVAAVSMVLTAVFMLGLDVTAKGLGFAALLAAMLGAGYPRLWLHDRIRQRAAAVLRALPFMLDMTTLCVEAGLNLAAALQQTAQKGPAGPLRDELRRVLGDIRTGVPRAQALRDMAERLNVAEMRSLVSALVQADALGMNLAPILRAQSDQRRTERFLKAEKLAMEAPVKMLFPLIAFIFPCTFVVIAFPIAVKLLDLAF